MNTRFHNAMARREQNIPPIWFMRQAGRYHSHYQAIRAKHSFMDLCRVPELAAEVAMGPIRDFDFDVAILFSDLLFPLDALGLGLSYETDGPKLATHLNPETIKTLTPFEKAIPALEFQRAALQATRAVLPRDKSLIGFVGGAWTLFVYAVEGSHAGNLLRTKQNLDLFPKFCEQLLPLLEANISLQLAGGAEVVMLFDTAAGELSPELFHRYVVPTLEQLAHRFPSCLGYYSKGTTLAHLRHPFFEKAELAGLGVDHRHHLPDLLSLRSTGFVQGNFDQALLHLETNKFYDELLRYLEPFQAMPLAARAAWVSGLGHGILPKTPEKNVRLFVDTVRERFA